MHGVDTSRESAGRGKQIRLILSLVLVLNLIVAAATLGYGFISWSAAMWADGFHSLLDAFANVVGIAGIIVAANARPGASVRSASVRDAGFDGDWRSHGRWRVRDRQVCYWPQAGRNGATGYVAMVARAARGGLREASLVLTDVATDVEPNALLAAIVGAPSAITAHNLRIRSSGGRNWVEVHVTVDPDLTVKDAHEEATDAEDAFRDEVGSETEVIVQVGPAEPPHTRPDPMFGQDIELTIDETPGPPFALRSSPSARKGNL